MLRIWVVIITMLVCSPVSAQTRLSEPSETDRLFALLVKDVMQPNNSYSANPQQPYFQKLLRQPDADLKFLEGLRHVNGAVRGSSAVGLAILKTDRSFNALLEWMKSDNMFRREEAIQTLGGFREQRCVAPLERMLIGDPEDQVRQAAMSELSRFDLTPEIEKIPNTSLKDKRRPIAMIAAQRLGKLRRSDAALDAAIAAVDAATDRHEKEAAVYAICENAQKRSVEHQLRLLEVLSHHKGEWDELLRDSIRSTLKEYVEASRLEPPFAPAVSDEQLRFWWKHAERLFNERMEFIKPDADKVYVDADFGRDKGDLIFAAKVDRAEYRVGDSIRLDLEFRNASKKPYSVVMPDIPSGWAPAMGYGFKITNRETHVEVHSNDPSDDYLGSYSGPPPFVTFSPGKEFKSSTCLQYLLPWRLPPLPEGMYELVVVFDSAKFNGINPKGNNLAGRWTAPAVVFSVKGAPRRDPKEIMQLIGEQVGDPFLEHDLQSGSSDRRRFAEWTVTCYGDDRLKMHDAYLRPFELKTKSEKK